MHLCQVLQLFLRVRRFLLDLALCFSTRAASRLVIGPGAVNGGRGRSSGEQHNFLRVTVKHLVSPRSGEENRSNIQVNISQLMGYFGWTKRSQGMSPQVPGFFLNDWEEAGGGEIYVRPESTVGSGVSALCLVSCHRLLYSSRTLIPASRTTSIIHSFVYSLT